MAGTGHKHGSFVDNWRGTFEKRLKQDEVTNAKRNTSQCGKKPSQRGKKGEKKRARYRRESVDPPAKGPGGLRRRHGLLCSFPAHRPITIGKYGVRITKPIG